MVEPSLDSLLGRVHSKYILVVLAAKRARRLMEEAQGSEEESHLKPVSQALREIADGSFRRVGPKRFEL